MEPFKYMKMTVTFKGLEESVYPYFLGSFIRGNFGMYLKKCVCPFGFSRDCQSCLIKNKCFYTEVFEAGRGGVSPETGVPPYVIDIAGDRFTEDQEVKDLSFNILLFGPALRNFEFFVLVFSEMGKKGIGKKRIKCKEVSVNGHDGKLIYSTKTDKLVSVPEELAFQFGSTQPVNRLKVRYRSPLRLLKNGKMVESPDFENLIRSSLRRLIYLERLYGTDIPAADIPLPTREIVAQSTKVETVTNNVQWVHQVRYSNRSKTKMDLGGIIGVQEFKGKIQPYHQDLLKFASIFHLGKSSTFGNGKIELN